MPITFKPRWLVSTSGTWTPVLADLTLSASEGQTASTAAGTWRRHGDIVYIWGKIDISGLGTLTTTETASIIGLPVAAVNESGHVAVVSFSDCLGLAIAAGTSINGAINGNTSHIVLRLWDVTTGTSGLLVSEVSVSGSLTFSGSYRAA